MSTSRTTICRECNACGSAGRGEEVPPTASETVLEVQGRETMLPGAGLVHNLENDLLYQLAWPPDASARRATHRPEQTE
jgi:hypothetical protein